MSTLTTHLRSSMPDIVPQGMLHWLSVVAHLDPRYGGLSAAVPKLASTIASHGEFGMSLAAFCGDDETLPSNASPGVAVSRWPLSRATWLKDGSLSARFHELTDNVDGLHIHGLWEQSSLAAIKAAHTSKLPYVLSAHGMLEPWALKNKRLKKLIYSTLIERSNVANASCLHALTQAEAEDYRRYCRSRFIAVIPNGVEIPKALSPELFLSQYSRLRGKRIVLFLGRIHFKKGLDILVKAWRQIALHHRDAHLVLAGPDSENSQSSIAAMVRQYELESSITFTAMLQENLKWSALAASECFVLPSFSEGLSVSALEAMGSGLPVILSDRCNLPEVVQHKAGWVIAAKVESLRRAIEEMLENYPSSNRGIGARGQALVRDHYTWQRVASQMAEIYTWVAGGNTPTLVEVQRGGRD